MKRALLSLDKVFIIIELGRKLNQDDKNILVI